MDEGVLPRHQMKKKPITPRNGISYVMSRNLFMRGDVIGSNPCNLECCKGTRLTVRWPDGRRTFPCSEGMSDTGNKDTVRITPLNSR